MLGFSTALRLGVHRWGLGGYGLFMFRFALTRAVVLVGGTAALALAGCTPSSPDEPTASPSVPVVSASPSVTVAPSETALSEEQLLELIPAEARTEDFPGAAAFAAFFVSEYYRMFAEQDPQLFEFMSGDECVFCASSLETYSELAATAGYRVGGEFTSDTAAATGSLVEDGSWYVELPIQIAPGVTYDGNGEVLGESSGGTGTAKFQLVWSEVHWSAKGVFLEQD